jgi:AraC-like DNA-binding protein
MYLLFLPSMLQTVCTIVVTSLLGVQGCAKVIETIYSGVIVVDRLDVLETAYLNLSYKSFNVIFFVELVASMVFLSSRLFVGKFKFAHISAFLRGEKSSFVANILCSFFIIYFFLWALCIVFMETFMNTLSIWSSLWSFFVALLLFFVGYVAAIPPLPGGYINIERMRHPFSAMRQSRQEFLQGINSGPVADTPSSGYDKIMESFQQVMIAEQGFLNPSMTIDEIAKKLNTNRTYVSKLVNIYYGVPFRDYLNNLRLDYAKRLLMDEPDAVIDYVAAKSGFQSSTQFIRKFRETEGVTPTVWRTLQRKK